MKQEEMKSLIKEAIREFTKENQKKNKRRVYQNTRLLLLHYNDLKDHIENAIDEINQIECAIDTSELDEDELYIMSIKRSKVKTVIMLAHIDVSLEKLEQKQQRQGTPERYRALEMYFFEEKDYNEIREELNCGINTPRRWIDQLVRELSVFIFGVDGLKSKFVV